MCLRLQCSELPCAWLVRWLPFVQSAPVFGCRNGEERALVVCETRDADGISPTTQFQTKQQESAKRVEGIGQESFLIFPAKVYFYGGEG